MMRLSQPRIAPASDLELANGGAVIPVVLGTEQMSLNIYRTLARNAAGMEQLMAWGNFLARGNTLPPREREIVILRVGVLCRSGYEFTQHAERGSAVGLTDAEIEKIKQGAEADWSASDAALIRACDELVTDHFITNQTWAALSSHFTETQCMDIVLVAGQYTMVSMALNSFGVQLEEGKTLDPGFQV